MTRKNLSLIQEKNIKQSYKFLLVKLNLKYVIEDVFDRKKIQMHFL